jgi:hypothetical protein
VLHGECVLIADDEEHALRQWDFVDLPAGVARVFAGAGDSSSAGSMIGSRRERTIHFPVGDLTARYEASVSTPTDDRAEAYANWRREQAATVPNPWRCSESGRRVAGLAPASALSPTRQSRSDCPSSRGPEAVPA